MPTTVGSHSIATFTSPVNGTSPIDANQVRGNDNTIKTAYVNHDADPGIHVQSSTLASRPAAGTAGRKWITADAGSYKLWFDDGTRWHEVGNDAIDVEVIADETIAKGDVLGVTGYNNGLNLPRVAKYAGSGPAFAIAAEAIANGARGYAINTGIISDIDTQSFGATGTILYPAATGTFTATKPTSGEYQVAAYVLRQQQNNGVLYVEFSAPRIVERSDNTASTIVLRDASGNFAAGTITAGALTSTGLVTFASLKGTGAVTVTDVLNDNTMATSSATTLATSSSVKAYVDAQVQTVDTLAEVMANGNTTGATDLIVNSGQKIRTPAVAAQDGTASIAIADSTGAVTLSAALADTNLATISTAGKVANSATTATATNTNSAIVARDGSGNFAAGTITATFAGNLTGNVTGNVSGSSGSTTGNAATATALQTARTINGTSFDGTANITVTAAAGTLSGNTLASGVTASSLTSVGTLSSLTVSGTFTGSTIAANSNSNEVVTIGSFRNADAGTDARTRVRLGNNAQENALTIDMLSSTNTVGGSMARIINQTGTGDLVLGTNGTEGMRLDASGNLGLGVTPVDANNACLQLKSGITFPATQSASSNVNTLDDYEEGLFTVTATPGTSGTITIDPDRSQIMYTKIGRVVYVSGGIQIFSVASPVGNSVVFSGLPFAKTAAGSTPAQYAPFTSTANEFIDASDSFKRILYPVELSDAGTSTQWVVFMDAATVETSDRYYFNFFYVTP